MKKNPDIKIVELNGNFFPFDPDHLKAFKDHSLANASDHQIYVFETQGSSSDFFNRPIESLSESLWRYEAFEAASQLRATLSKLRTSGALSVLLCHGDCFSFLFDIGLGFDALIFTRRDSFVGFPEITAGVFPFLGGFERRIEDHEFSRRDWEEKPIAAARDLSGADFLFFSTKHSWKQCLIDILPTLVKKKNRSKAKKIPKFSEPHKISEESAVKLSQHYSSLHFFWPESRPWHQIGELIREKINQKNPTKFLEATLFLNIRFLFSEVFLNWAKRFSVLETISSSRLRGIEPKKKRPAVIDLDFLVPPVEPIIRLARSGIGIVFSYSETSRLKESLELFFARLEKKLGKIEALRFWQKNITWSLCDSEKIDAYFLLQWLPNDELHIFRGEQEKLQFLRFSGNRTNAACGWVEMSVPEKEWDSVQKGEAFSLVESMSDGIIKTGKIADSEVSVSTFVRSAFLQELTRFSSSARQGLNRILPVLKEYGWGYVAEENAWEYFLRSRDESFSVDPRKLNFGNFQLDPTTWSFGLWKEVKEFTRRPDGKQVNLNPAQISRHFALFAGVLAKILARSTSVANVNQADIVVLEALGFPERYGTPLSHLENFGNFRLERLTGSIWAKET